MGNIVAYHKNFPQRGWEESDCTPNGAPITTEQTFGYNAVRQQIGGKISSSLTDASHGFNLGGSLSLSNTLQFDFNFQLVSHNEGGGMFGWYRAGTVQTSDLLGAYIKWDSGGLFVRPVVWTNKGRGWQIRPEVLIKSTSPYPEWVSGTNYNVAGAQVRRNYWIYEQLANHTASATNEPGVGAQWTTYWRKLPLAVIVANPFDLHNVSFDYNPAGDGTMTIVVDGFVSFDQVVPSGFKLDGVTFNRWGMRNIFWYAESWIEIYISAISFTGVSGLVTPNLATAPSGWVSVGTPASFSDSGTYENQDIKGTSAIVSGKAIIRIGGRFHQKEPNSIKTYKAAVLPSTLNMNDNNFQIKCKGRMIKQNVDSGLFIAFFRAANIGPPASLAGVYPPNILGIRIAGDTEVGHNVRPFVAMSVTTSSTGFTQLVQEVIRPDSVDHEIIMEYDRNIGSGRITAWVDGVAQILNLSSALRAIGASFTHAGVFPQVYSGGGPLFADFGDITFNWE